MSERDETRIDMLEHDLAALGRQTEFPATPPIAAAVRARLAAEPDPERTHGTRLPTHRRQRLASLLAIAAALVVGSTVVAGVLGLPGLRFSFGPGPSASVTPSDPAGIRSSLGTPSSLADAASAVAFPILLPPKLGEPDETYVGSTNREHGRVVLLYTHGDAPPIAGDIRLLITEFTAELDEGFDTKWVESGDTRVQYVDVNGARGYWFSGAPHVYEYLNEIAGIRQVERRQVGDVLVWERAGVVYRIESGLGPSATLELARSLT